MSEGTAITILFLIFFLNWLLLKRDCPHCKKRMWLTAKACPHCGRDRKGEG